LEPWGSYLYEKLVESRKTLEKEGEKKRGEGEGEEEERGAPKKREIFSFAFCSRWTSQQGSVGYVIL
jgi:hypothetical protein